MHKLSRKTGKGTALRYRSSVKTVSGLVPGSKNDFTEPGKRGSHNESKSLLNRLIIEPKSLSIPSQDILSKVKISTSKPNWGAIINVWTLRYKHRELEQAFQKSLNFFIGPNLLIAASFLLAFALVGLVSPLVWALFLYTIPLSTFFLSIIVISILWIIITMLSATTKLSEKAFFVGSIAIFLVWMATNIAEHIVSPPNFALDPTSSLSQLILLVCLLPIPFIPLNWALSLWIFGLCTINIVADVAWDIIITAHASRIDFAIAVSAYFVGLLFIAKLTYTGERECRYYFYNMCVIKSRLYKNKRHYDVERYDPGTSYNDLDVGLEDEKVIRIVEAMAGVVRRGDIAFRTESWRSEAAKMKESYEKEVEENLHEAASENLEHGDSAEIEGAESVAARKSTETFTQFQQSTDTFSTALTFHFTYSPVGLLNDSGCGKVWNWNVLALENDASLGGNVLFEVGRVLTSPLIKGKERESRLAPILQTHHSTKIPCTEEVLFKFLKSVQDGYRDNPYHNQFHAAEVAHLATCIATMEGIRSSDDHGFCFPENIDYVGIAGPIAEFAFVVAALAHDIGHPGLTNAFLVNSGSSLALTYNDVSVLENFHAATLFEVASLPGSQIFEKLQERHYWEVRKRIIELILATDMARHFSEIGEFRLRIISPDFNWVGRADDGWMFARFCLKGADIGHGALEWEQHRIWSDKVMEEFYKQGDEESRIGFKRSPLCERQTLEVYANSQHGFLQCVVVPLFEELSDMCPTSSLDETCMIPLLENLANWRQISESSKQTEATVP